MSPATNKTKWQWRSGIVSDPWFLFAGIRNCLLTPICILQSLLLTHGMFRIEDGGRIRIILVQKMDGS